MDTARKFPDDADAFLAEIGELAKRDGALGLERDLVGLFDRAVAKLDQLPLEVDMSKIAGRPLKLKVGSYALRFFIAKFYLGDPDSFRYLPKLLDDIDKGREPVSIVFNLRQLLSSPLSLAWFTTDAAIGASNARLELIEKQAAKARLHDAMNFPFPAINAIWKIADAGDAARAAIRSDMSTLFVVGSLDGITPPSQTMAIAAGFRNSHTTIVENGGHVSSFRAPRLNNAIADFLQKGTAPAQFAMPPVQFVPALRTL
jgi:hypothetical protein